jgi:hypothetical protein
MTESPAPQPLPVEGQRHWFGPSGQEGKGNKPRGRGHPLLFGKNKAQDFAEFPDGGGYPIGFLEYAYEWMGVTCPDLVLHLCSG